MQISSMTGFARQSGSLERENFSLSWVWEIKSVNGKNLDLKVRLPLWLDEVSLNLRNIAASCFERGSLGVTLDIVLERNEAEVRVNRALLDKVTEAALTLYRTYPEELARPSAAELLKTEGMLEVVKNRFDEEELAEICRNLRAGFEECCIRLQFDRRQEGQKIKTVLEERVDRIEILVQEVARLAVAQPALLKQKLSAQLAELLEGAPISEERLAQEAVLLVNRADIREEIDRLTAHVKTARELLAANQTLGRRFDFLCQEFNRETNTICSKASDIEIINRGMELKAVIEQLREQVQNME